MRINQQLLLSLNREARFMYQDERLLVWKTVLGTVRVGVRANWHQHARELLHQVGLHDRSDDWISQLTGGERQRFALARS